MVSPATMIISRSIDVAQLAHVAGPLVLLQPRHRFGRQPLGPPAVLRRHQRHEVLGQQRDVLLPSRSGGTKIGITFSRKYRSSRNAARANLRRQVLVGRGEHAHVDLDRAACRRRAP